MPFTSSLDIAKGVAMITLTGELDAAAAPAFRADVEKAVAANVMRLVLMMQELSYMASAGLRALVFAKQKMGAAADVYVIGMQPAVKETLELTGFDRSVILSDTYDPSTVEAG
jgi:anti-anti-sigma factor